MAKPDEELNLAKKQVEALTAENLRVVEIANGLRNQAKRDAMALAVDYKSRNTAEVKSISDIATEIYTFITGEALIVKP